MRKLSKHGKRAYGLEGSLLLLSVPSLALVVLFREVLPAVPLLAFAATLVLFMLPGAFLARTFLGSHYSIGVVLPVAFVSSAGLFGLAAVPPLALHWRLETYFWICGALVAVAMSLAVVGVFLRELSAEGGAGEDLSGTRRVWLWVPFLALAAALAYASTLQRLGGDAAVYTAWVREFLSSDGVGLREPFYGEATSGFSRVDISGWLLEQAAFSRVSGIDPADLVFGYLSPVLVVAALLAVYALARILFESESAALLTGISSALFFLIFLIYLGTETLTPGELVRRAAEDKYVARFVFLPVTLGVAVLFLRERRARYLALFAFLCWAAVTVHPLGPVLVGVSLAGFGLAHLAFERERRAALYGLGALGIALCSVVLAPAVYFLYSLTSGVSYAVVRGSFAHMSPVDPNMVGQGVLAQEDTDKLLILGDGWYMMHPSLLLNPFVLAALLLGIPLLLPRLRESMAARLLVGVSLLSLFILYVPPVASFLAGYVGPGQLWRFSWPLSLVVLLIFGWMVWRLVRYAEERPGAPRVARRVASFLPLLLSVILVAGVASSAPAQTKEQFGMEDSRRNQRGCANPVFGFMRDTITTPSVVLAEEKVADCVAAYSAPADIVSFRGQRYLENQATLEENMSTEVELPQRTLDVNRFFTSATLDEEAVRILQHYEVDYVLLPTESPLVEQLESNTAFRAVDSPGQRQFRLYEVDLEALRSTEEL